MPTSLSSKPNEFAVVEQSISQLGNARLALKQNYEELEQNIKYFNYQISEIIGGMPNKEQMSNHGITVFLQMYPTGFEKDLQIFMHAPWKFDSGHRTQFDILFEEILKRLREINEQMQKKFESGKSKKRDLLEILVEIQKKGESIKDGVKDRLNDLEAQIVVS